MLARPHAGNIGTVHALIVSIDCICEGDATDSNTPHSQIPSESGHSRGAELMFALRRCMGKQSTCTDSAKLWLREGVVRL